MPMSPLDAMFLWGETPETMFHVAGLAPFTPPPDAPPDFLRAVVDDARAERAVQKPWNRRLRHARLLGSPLQSWVVTDEADIDLDYHLRRSGLASPGDERELGVLVSRLHSHQLDFSRPPWEMHLIEGLESGRFATYTKIHHSLVDGYTAAQVLERSLSKDDGQRDTPLFFNADPPGRAVRDRGADDDGGGVDLGALVGAVSRRARSGLTLAGRVVGPVLRPGHYDDLVGNLSAPKCLLNRRIGRNRRFATQQYELQRIKDIGQAHGATLNDVFLAVCGGGLRRFLEELGELPDKPLVAMVPVNVRPKGDAGGGNAVGSILASMGTDVTDPVERLERVVASTTAAKAQLEGMTQEAILAYSAWLLSPMGLGAASAMTGIPSLVPLPFNVIVSNVPGPRDPLYLRGARLEATYPVSIPVHGVALNITVQSYAGTLCVGFVGCRDTVPHLQRLAVHTGAALDELDAAS